ncbi:helix-turn-helix domain-containing protein [Halanaerobium hydrogeniformans]|uniref:Helix-turn-helix domain-containing protein n=1 Tax=Halanaerobium hydrogeniformans TaxID=656519 RepID=E4RNJ7_HALHG|nr:helix-turn-helix domain-containing protein [Halanaerobium hydrogeniformans]ADQ13532.1 hypothetical protein Halsa_0032 [Halanaerobium hydrogeniformans]
MKNNDKYQDNENLFKELSRKSRKDLPFTLSPADLVQILPYGKTKVYELLNRSIIPAKKLEGKWVIPRDKFLAWFYSDLDNKSS